MNPEIYKTSPEDTLAHHAEAGLRGQGAVVEATLRLKKTIETMDATLRTMDATAANQQRQAHKLNKTMLGLTVVTVGLTVVQAFLAYVQLTAGR